MKRFCAKPRLNATFKMAQPLPLLADSSVRNTIAEALSNRQIPEDLAAHLANLPLARQTPSTGVVQAEN
jgi:hypothetical protein